MGVCETVDIVNDRTDIEILVVPTEPEVIAHLELSLVRELHVGVGGAGSLLVILVSCLLTLYGDGLLAPLLSGERSVYSGLRRKFESVGINVRSCCESRDCQHCGKHDRAENKSQKLLHHILQNLLLCAVISVTSR